MADDRDHRVRWSLGPADSRGGRRAPTTHGVGAAADRSGGSPDFRAASFSSRATTVPDAPTATDIDPDDGSRNDFTIPGASVATTPETSRTDGFERHLEPVDSQMVSGPFVDAFEDQMSNLGRRVRQVMDLSTMDYEIVSVTALRTEDSATQIARYYRQQMSRSSWSTYADFGDDTLLVLQSNVSPHTYLVIAPVDGSQIREYVSDFSGVVLYLIDVT